MIQRALALITAGLVLCAGGPLSARDVQTVKLLHFGDLNGGFADLACNRSERGTVDFSNFLFLLDSEKRGGHYLVLSPGNVLGDAPYFDFLLNQGESGIATIAQFLERTEAELFVPGVSEFGIPYRMFMEFLPDFINLGARFAAVNVSCPGTPGACSLQPANGPPVVERGGVRIGLIPLSGPRIAGVVHPDNVSGLKFDDAAEIASRLAHQLRTEQKVDLVIAVVNLEAARGPASETISFLGKVDGVDIVVAGGLTGEGGLPLPESAWARDGRVLLLGSPSAPDHLGVVTLKLERKGRRWVIDRADAAIRKTGSFRKVNEVSSILSQGISEFCSLAARVLGTGRVDPEMDWATFTAYVMEIIRREMATDLVVLSEDSIKLDRDDKLKGPVRVDRTYKAFAKHEVIVLKVLGKDVAGFVNTFLDSPGKFTGKVFLRGASRDPDKTIKINDRTINPSRWYTISTTDFLASGGKGYLKTLLASANTRKVPSGYFVREMVQRFFERDSFVRPGMEPVISLEHNFDSLWDLPLWEFMSRLDAGFSNISITNPGDYTETQLSRSEFTGITGDGQLTVAMTTRNHVASEFLKIQYAVASAGEEQDLGETKDLVTNEVTYSWTALRNRTYPPRIFLPSPVAKAKVETEFSKPDENDHHHLELTGVAGIQWLFGTKASAGVAYGARTEALDPAGEWHKGVEVYYRIESLPLYTYADARSIKLESRFDLFYSDWSSDDIVKGTGSAKLSAPLIRPLSFTVGADAFFYRAGAADVSYSIDTMVGLSIAYDAAMQVF